MTQCGPGDLIGWVNSPRFVIFASYGNDSVALIQWAFEAELRDVVVVYSDTQWSSRDWDRRVSRLERWVHRLGYSASRTQSIGFAELARQKKATPTQQYQWCSFALKIEPSMRWLEKHDPERRAVCLVGVRREESASRAKFPAFLARSPNHGDRVMLAPLVDYDQAARDALLHRAGVDLIAMDEESISRAEALEAELNELYGPSRNGKPRTFFRPNRHMGAVGVREVVRWAKSGRGRYRNSEPEENLGGCDTGFCGI